ncbi:nucleoside 2-deoxyribosyltransferase [Streptomyces sp. NPDC058953]|uniref:nucleoside 2-deoxyribosyltransferase n=1 Tax=unclassified Streptomyces TaxID=2593676 RepID=UPI0036A94641
MTETHIDLAENSYGAAPDLSGVNVFVGGPIQHALGNGEGFHAPLQNAIHDIIEAATAAKATVFSAHVAEKFGVDTPLFTPDQVSVRDFNWMRRCDVFVPVLPVVSGELLRTDGTHIELGWASAQDKPIVVVTPTPLAENASHLLRGLPTVARVKVVDLHQAKRYPEALIGLLASVTGKVGAAT